MKQKTEKALKEQQYGDPVEDDRIYLLCAMANYHLGYLIIAQHVLNKFCGQHIYQYPAKREDSMKQKTYIEGNKLLGDILFGQGNYEQAIKHYTVVIKGERLTANLIREAAFQLAKIY